MISALIFFVYGVYSYVIQYEYYMTLEDTLELMSNRVKSGAYIKLAVYNTRELYFIKRDLVHNYVVLYPATTREQYYSLIAEETKGYCNHMVRLEEDRQKIVINLNDAALIEGPNEEVTQLLFPVSSGEPHPINISYIDAFKRIFSDCTHIVSSHLLQFDPPQQMAFDLFIRNGLGKYHKMQSIYTKEITKVYIYIYIYSLSSRNLTGIK